MFKQGADRQIALTEGLLENRGLDDTFAEAVDRGMGEVVGDHPDRVVGGLDGLHDAPEAAGDNIDVVGESGCQNFGRFFAGQIFVVLAGLAGDDLDRWLAGQCFDKTCSSLEKALDVVGPLDDRDPIGEEGEGHVEETADIVGKHAHDRLVIPGAG